MAAKNPSDIGNTIVRLFLQDLGRAYDQERGFTPYTRRKDFASVLAFFDGCCCYCGATTDLVEDHLVPANKDGGGLHAHGNVVPACRVCNARKHGRLWLEFLLDEGRSNASVRKKRIEAFVAGYGYAPKHNISQAANDLYQEAIETSIALKNLKVKSVTETG